MPRPLPAFHASHTIDATVPAAGVGARTAVEDVAVTIGVEHLVITASTGEPVCARVTKEDIGPVASD